MMNTKVPSGVAVTMIAVGIAVIASIEWRVLYVRDHPPPHRIDAVYCTRCHSDAATLQAMKLKEGNTHFLFHGPDSSFGKTALRQIKASAHW